MDFRNPHFAEPGWLWLAVLAPVGLICLHRYATFARRKQLARFAAPELLADLTRSHSVVRRSFKHVLLVLAIMAMGLALARPQWGQTTEVSIAVGEDILFVLDCSKSMLATDVLPSRLQRAKYAIMDFVQKHGRGRVGLVAFSGDAFLQCPLTFDYDAFREALLAVDERSIPVAGTDIGRALDEGYRAMEKNERHKVMVLVTDGEDLEKTGVTKAQTLAGNGVVIYTIGVGTTTGSPIQVMNERGLMEPLRAPDGSPVVSHLDEATLREIAAATHGAYQPLGAVGEGLEQVRRQVEGSDRKSDFSKTRTLGVDRFYFPVGAVTLLIVVESLIGTRRKSRLAQS